MDESSVEKVFGCWNSYKGQLKGGKPWVRWRGHPKKTTEIDRAVRLRLREYSVEELCGAINNYAKILLGRDYKWTYAWRLYEFMLRHRPNQRDELQLWQFLDNNFCEWDYLTDAARQKRKEAARTTSANEVEEFWEKVYAQKRKGTGRIEKFRQGFGKAGEND